MKNLLLINTALTILFLSDTYAGSVHGKRVADASPPLYPQAAGCSPTSAFWPLRPGRDLMPTKQRGHGPHARQKAANRHIACRRIRIEPVNSRVKRCRIVLDTNRLRKAGARDLVMDICCALHNFRVRHSLATNGLIEMNSNNYRASRPQSRLTLYGVPGWASPVLATPASHYEQPSFISLTFSQFICFLFYFKLVQRIELPSTNAAMT